MHSSFVHIANAVKAFEGSVKEKLKLYKNFNIIITLWN